MKLAIVVDSSCGLTKEQAEQRGWFFLPLMITIDGKEYTDGVDLTARTFSKVFHSDSLASTSFTPIGYTMELLKRISPEYDFVVIYPISQYLSSQMQNLEVIAKEHNNVFVIKSKSVAQLIVRDLVELEQSVLKNELTVKQAIDKIEKRSSSNLTEVLLFPESMDALVRGGRVSSTMANIGKLLKITPVISLQNGKLEKFAKGRTFTKTVVNYTVDHYNKLKSKNKNLVIAFLDAVNPNADNLFFQIRNEIPNYQYESIRFSIPPVIAVHVGFGAVCSFVLELERPIEDYQFDKID